LGRELGWNRSEHPKDWARILGSEPDKAD
jgi:hypothetical protein